MIFQCPAREAERRRERGVLSVGGGICGLYSRFVTAGLDRFTFVPERAPELRLPPEVSLRERSSWNAIRDPQVYNYPKLGPDSIGC